VHAFVVSAMRLGARLWVSLCGTWPQLSSVVIWQ